MAYGLTHFFPGGTQEQYVKTVTAVHGDMTSLPKGQIFHAAGPSPGGWTIIAVHDTKESWEKFRDGTLNPKMQEGIDGGFASQPEETAMDLYTVLP